MKVKLTKFRTAPPQYAMVETNATIGATVGVDLLGPDGKVIQWGQIANAEAGAASPLNTTDDLQEGQWNLWFTPRRAQDAVGSILADSANVTLRYVGGTSIKANLTEITDSGVGTALVKITRDAYGRIEGTEAATTTNLPEGTNLYFTNARAITAVGSVSGAGGEVLVADGMSAPPIMLTNEAEDDFLYAG